MAERDKPTPDLSDEEWEKRSRETRADITAANADRQHDRYLEIADKFFEAPSHGTGADVLDLIYHDVVVAERTALNGSIDFFVQVPDGCVYEPFPTIRATARAELEKAVDVVFEAKVKHTDGKRIKDLYALAGKAKKAARTKDFIAGTLAFFSDKVLVEPSIPWNETPEAAPTTTKVIDFSGGQLVARLPRKGEYFRDPVPCTADEILAAGDAPIFQEFLASLFANLDTRRSALECFAMCISGRASKTFQVWWNAEGDGGKNTAADLQRELIPNRAVMAKNALILHKGDSSERRFGEMAFPRFRGHPIVHPRSRWGAGVSLCTTLPRQTQPRPTIRKVFRPSHPLSAQLAFCPLPSS